VNRETGELNVTEEEKRALTTGVYIMVPMSFHGCVEKSRHPALLTKN
jgi:hypothetical protein